MGAVFQVTTCYIGLYRHLREIKSSFLKTSRRAHTEHIILERLLSLYKIKEKKNQEGGENSFVGSADERPITCVTHAHHLARLAERTKQGNKRRRK